MVMIWHVSIFCNSGMQERPKAGVICWNYFTWWTFTSGGSEWGQWSSSWEGNALMDQSELANIMTCCLVPRRRRRLVVAATNSATFTYGKIANSCNICSIKPIVHAMQRRVTGSFSSRFYSTPCQPFAHVLVNDALQSLQIPEQTGWWLARTTRWWTTSITGWEWSSRFGIRL